MVLWHKSETFRAIVLGMWEALKTFWEFIDGPVMAVLRTLAAFYAGVFKLAWQAITAYVTGYIAVSPNPMEFRE